MTLRGADASPTERRRLALTAVLTLMPFVVLAVLAASDTPTSFDQFWLNSLSGPPGLLGTISSTLNLTGNLPIWIGVVALAAVLIGIARGFGAGLLVALSLVSDVAAFAVKMLLERERPDTAAVRQFFGADAFSYPSGHTVRAAAFVAAVVWVVAPRRWRLPLTIAAGLGAGAAMGYARVSLGVHWPTDVIGGTFLGMCWLAVTAWLLSAQQLHQADGAQR